jgi:hypothetical protein
MQSDSSQSRNRRLESAVGAFILFLLLLVGIGIFIRQSDYNLSRFGMGVTTAGTVSRQRPFEITPADGFKQLSDVEIYNPDNLYEKIDGKAPVYLECGFVELLSQRFVSKDTPDLWMEVEIFDMACVKNAFSIYSMQKRADAAVLENFDSRYAYKTANALYFINGQYYIELTGSAESEKLLAAMAETAEFIKGKMTVKEATNIPELDLFPAEHKVADSAKLYLTNAFGFDKFSDVFTCRFDIDGQSITAFFSKHSDQKDAQSAADSYYKFLLENGAKAKTTSSQTLKDAQARVLDLYGATEIVFVKEQFVAGIHEADKQPPAESAAEMLFQKLGESTKK